MESIGTNGADFARCLLRGHLALGVAHFCLGRATVVSVKPGAWSLCVHLCLPVVRLSVQDRSRRGLDPLLMGLTCETET